MTVVEIKEVSNHDREEPDVNYTKALANMVEKVQQIIGQPTLGNQMDVLADNGYYLGK